MPKAMRRARITPVTIAPVMDVSGFMAAPSPMSDVMCPSGFCSLAGQYAIIFGGGAWWGGCRRPAPTPLEITMPDLMSPERPPSPCTKVCTLDEQGFCAGCLRTGAEIGRWMSMSAEEQWQLIAQLEARRRLRDRGSAT